MSESYMVVLKLREESYGGSAEEAAFMLTDQIIPSLEMLERMEKEGKVMGGFFEGQRAATFVFDVDDDKELDRILASVPIMDVYDIEIAPIQSITSALQRDRRIVSDMKASAGL